MATMNQLDALADAIPVMNKKAADQARANRQVQLQSQIGSAQVPAGQTGIRSAQAAAPGQIAAEGAAAAQTINTNAQQLSEVAGIGLAQKGAEADAALQRQTAGAQEQLSATANRDKVALARSDIVMRKKVTGKELASAQRMQKVGIEVDNKLQIATLRQREQLDRLGGDVRSQILDSRLHFERDEMGRKFTNERQLADYVTATAKTDQEFSKYMRDAAQAGDRKIQLMEIAERKLSSSLHANWEKSENLLDKQNQARIAKMAADLRARIAREQSGRAGRMAMWQAGGTIVGAVVGGVIGAAAGGVGAAPGAMIGATVGGAAGTMIGGYVEGEG